ncbi:hypothetical protein [Tomitella cavernea]|uniref:Secreted protein n=1 Tax=Tomitella cavernea TaxID=1387982 RepID=A0ABP9D051_9ACTN|nr:hypothetical protein [Tomitella cavernea]
MRTHTSALKRVVGGGFAMAVAAAFIVPGVASAEDNTDAGSSELLGSITDILGDTGSSETDAADEGDSMFGSVTAVLGCFSSDEGTGTDNEDADTGTGSITTIIDCVMGAIGGDDNGDGGDSEGTNTQTT